MTDVPQVKLNTGATIPQLGLGTARTDDPTIRRIVSTAIDVGYRLVDTAAMYENEVGVGQGIADSGVPRGELFVTTKLRGSQQGYEQTRQALHESLERLGLDYVDLYLVHWPLPRVGKYVESWRAMDELRAEGLVRAIGVSNFLPEHLDRLADETSAVPAVNQIELHPQLPQREQLADDASRGIVTESWAPLANGGLLKEPALVEVARRHGRSVVQVLLAWQLRQGIVVIPKASSAERLRENLDVFDLHLTDDDLAAVATLENGTRSSGQDPAVHEEF